jgi:hypothetical protein
MRARATLSRWSLGAALTLPGVVAFVAGCSADVERSSTGQSGGAGGSGATGKGGTGGTTGGSGGSGGGGGTSGKAGSGSGGSVSAGAGGAGGQVAASAALESGARRLTRTELDNAVRDLLGDDEGPAARFLAEDEFNPFDNDYTIQRASSALIDSLEAFADAAAARAVLPENRDTIVPCTPSGPDDSACLEETIVSLGARLFRRPFTTADAQPYMALQAFATEDNPDVPHDFYTAVELVLRSMLQDPEFLYRIESGTADTEPGVFRLSEYEMATRLSFLVWSSTPDQALLDAAAAGELLDPVARRAEAERLLADDRARTMVQRFHAMWLGYRAIPGTADLIQAFSLETNSLIDRVVFDDPTSYLDLFLSPETYLTTELADHYGLDQPSGGEGWVSYGSSGRGGILSHGSVLAGFSKFSDTSPTQRGIFVQTRLLCNTVEPPPANVNVDQPPASDDLVCKTDRYAAHRDTPSCAGCHSQLDPIGFGLEQYDVAGRFRTTDDGYDECPLTGEGELPDYGTFNGPAELGRLLVDSGEVESCFVQHLLSYVLGRPVKAEEASLVAALTGEFANQGYAATTLIADYAASDRFALRREEPEP